MKVNIRIINHANKTARLLILILVAYTVLILMDYSTDHQHIWTVCIFKNVFGIPCAGCGMGRGTLELLKGNFAMSFSYNILCIPISIAVFFSIIWLLLDLIKGSESYFKFINRRTKAIYLLPFILLTAISWIINIIRGI